MEVFSGPLLMMRTLMKFPWRQVPFLIARASLDGFEWRKWWQFTQTMVWQLLKEFVIASIPTLFLIVTVPWETPMLRSRSPSLSALIMFRMIGGILCVHGPLRTYSTTVLVSEIMKFGIITSAALLPSWNDSLQCPDLTQVLWGVVLHVHLWKDKGF